MATKRHSKTWEQQAKYYEVDNIAEYMVENYLNGNIGKPLSPVRFCPCRANKQNR